VYIDYLKEQIGEADQPLSYPLSFPKMV